MIRVKGVKPAADTSKHVFRPRQQVFVRFDGEKIHCIIIGRTGSPKKPTYIVTNWERNRVWGDIPQKDVSKLS